MNLFMYLPSTLDCKGDFLHWKDNVHLHPVNLTFDDIKQAAGQNLMGPCLLDNKDLRSKVRSGYYKIMKKIAEVSNQNLVRNSDAFISSGVKTDPEKEFLGLTTLTNYVRKSFS